MVDQDGREWRVVGIDEDELCRRDDVCDLEQREPEGTRGPAGVSYLQSYTTPATPAYDPKGLGGGIPAGFIAKYGADDRTLVLPAAMTDRQRKVVSLYFRFRSGGTLPSWATVDPDFGCSASIIGDFALLTAAHCVSDPGPNGTWPTYDSDQVRACTTGNAATNTVCFNITDIKVNSNWTNAQEAKWDIAVLTSDIDLSVPYGSFLLENNDAALSGSTAHNVAYPAWGPGGSHSVSFPGNNGSLSQIEMYIQENEVVQKNNGVLDTHMDGTEGQSGSPIYWCPANGSPFCEVNEAGTQVGVWHGYFDSTVVTDRFVQAVSVASRHQWLVTQRNNTSGN